jgi:hypothetical protein
MYAGTADVRLITNLSTSDISDANLNSLITYAAYEMNSDIGVTLYTRLGDSNYFIGDYDGSNKTFALKFSPLGDLNNDGTVDTSDIEVWSKANTADVYTKMTSGTATISSIDDHEMGKFTFTTTPSLTNDYIVKYVWFPIPFNHPLLKRACAELTAYLAFLKANLKDVDSYRLGKMEVRKTTRFPNMANYYERYTQTLGQIRASTIFRPVTWEMVNKMSSELVESITV